MPLPALDLPLVVLVVSDMLNVLVVGTAIWRRRAAGTVAEILALYALAACLLGMGQVALRWGWLAEPSAHAVLYSTLLLAALFLQLTRAFLRTEGAGWAWWGLGLVCGIALIMLEGNFFGLRDSVGMVARLSLQRATLSQAVFTFGWGVYAVSAVWLTYTSYRRFQQPLHRNRIRYWTPGLLLVSAGGLSYVIGEIALASGLSALGGALAAVVVLSHQLPDVRQVARRVLTYAIFMMLLAAILFVAISLLPLYILPSSNFGPFVAAGLLALTLAVGFNPLLNLVRRFAHLLVATAEYDPARTVREYSLSISNILDLDQLAQVALGLIGRALGVPRGALFLVDQPAGSDGSDQVALRPVRGLGTEDLRVGQLDATGPVAVYLAQEHKPLTQYDIDLLPRLRQTSPNERAWLADLHMDVYVPINAQGKWIGLLALGSKVSRDRYFDDDLALLSTLADQTAVALENARLVEDLRRLNHDLQQLYAALDQTNQQLALLDRTKSEFIDNVAHELRTPLSVILGYSQFLSAAPEIKANEQFQKMMNGVQRSATRMHDLVNGMLDVSLLETGAFEIDRQPVALAAVVREVSARYEVTLAERRLTLKIHGLGECPEIEADAEALGRAFDHLLVNAIKYTPDGGRIDLAGQARPEALPGGAVEVILGDTGIGVDPRLHETIFLKFYQTGGKVDLQAAGKTKFKAGGPGLGLTLARGIVEAHGGKVWVESPGRDEAAFPGSRFHVLLPVQASGRRENS